MQVEICYKVPVERVCATDTYGHMRKTFVHRVLKLRFRQPFRTRKHMRVRVVAEMAYLMQHKSVNQPTATSRGVAARLCCICCIELMLTCSPTTYYTTYTKKCPLSSHIMVHSNRYLLTMTTTTTTTTASTFTRCHCALVDNIVRTKVHTHTKCMPHTSEILRAKAFFSCMVAVNKLQQHPNTDC